MGVRPKSASGAGLVVDHLGVYDPALDLDGVQVELEPILQNHHVLVNRDDAGDKILKLRLWNHDQIPVLRAHQLLHVIRHIDLQQPHRDQDIVPDQTNAPSPGCQTCPLIHDSAPARDGFPNVDILEKPQRLDEGLQTALDLLASQPLHSLLLLALPDVSRLHPQLELHVVRRGEPQHLHRHLKQLPDPQLVGSQNAVVAVPGPKSLVRPNFAHGGSPGHGGESLLVLQEQKGVHPADYLQKGPQDPRGPQSEEVLAETQDPRPERQGAHPPHQDLPVHPLCSGARRQGDPKGPPELVHRALAPAPAPAPLATTRGANGDHPVRASPELV
ncbi:hypothetical protein OJ252_3728 [Cryptosporidium canis]|uniref:Uncharacterized protein n=1 Tax=Cryptosporidium canis TaxID=195482 RepID=A0ABQ8P1H1_9CRYT|nr:hypothetical protein OJ252_3728 [Cryptosporidium canis]